MAERGPFGTLDEVVDEALKYLVHVKWKLNPGSALCRKWLNS